MTRIATRPARRRTSVVTALFALASVGLLAIGATARAAVDSSQPRTAAVQDGRIFFVDGSTGQIVSTTASGSGRKVLKGQGNNPAVSPDGTRIAYEMSTDRGIAVENADGTGRQTLVPGAGGMPSWSPDGTQIAYTSDSDIAVVTVATKAVTYLTHDSSTTEEVAPAWSPNGQWIAYTVRGCGPDGGGRCIYRMDAATGANRVNLTPYDGEDSTSDEADWSPTDALAYSSGGCSGGGINIWTMTSSGNNKTDLTCDENAYNSDRSPSWAPSGTKLAFVSDERVDKNYDQLYEIAPDGTQLAHVDTGSRFGIADPDWAVAPTTQTTSVTLNAQPTSIQAGQPVTLAGRMSPASGQGYAGQSVVILAATGASTTYTKVKTVKTTANGTFTTKLKPTTTTSYKTSYAGNPTLAFNGSVSPAVQVTVN